MLVKETDVDEGVRYGLYQQFQQEQEIGASEWNDYLDQVVDLLQRIHSGDDTPEKRREFDA